uniref:Putative secreted protein n=1 Tax=Anopheles triannulatus TaxID=58253 RepID=A0A2M4B1K5_9DIPT
MKILQVSIVVLFPLLVARGVNLSQTCHCTAQAQQVRTQIYDLIAQILYIGTLLHWFPFQTLLDVVQYTARGLSGANRLDTKRIPVMHLGAPFSHSLLDIL